MLLNNNDLHAIYKRRARSRATSAAALAVCIAGIFIALLVALLVTLAQGCAGSGQDKSAMPAVAIVSHERVAAPELTGFPSMDSEIYPEPVCPWCGGIMDGHGCQCNGVTL